LLYSAVDVLVVPSRQDNLPNTVMEALACGTPCVAFEVGGLPDLITHRMNGYLAQPFSVEDLAQGIGWALANREALTAQIRADALDRFDVLKVAQAHLRLYDRLLTTSA
jgi:glycosyltransferase involved in cell wall biosynthesis